MKDTEDAFSNTSPPTNIHTSNTKFTNIILQAEKHNIPNGKMHTTFKLLADHITTKIQQKYTMRNANNYDPSRTAFNAEISSDIYTHTIKMEHRHSHWYHRHNTHLPWKAIHGLSNKPSTLTINNTIPFNTKTATTAKARSTNDLQTHNTNRSINRSIHKLQSHNITLTTTHVEKEIKQCKNNNYTCPDKLNILKPNKDINISTLYIPISILSVIAKIWRSSFFHTLQTTHNTGLKSQSSDTHIRNTFIKL